MVGAQSESTTTEVFGAVSTRETIRFNRGPVVC